MRRRIIQLAIVLAISLFLVPAAAWAVTPLNVYRFYNHRTGTHFYTASADEMASVERNWPNIYSFEGVAYTIDASSPDAKQALYRFYNSSTGAHFYTASDAERDAVIARWGNVFRYEGVAYMVSTVPVAGGAAVYRFYNATTRAHFYTASDAERDAVIARWGNVFSYEGIAFYVPQAPQAPIPAIATGDLAVAEADLAHYVQVYPLLAGTTVEMGNASGYQAISYFSAGRIVISPSHTASVDVIMAHEIWHVIDWRDNGVIDWGENVPPANAATYVGRTN
jgi:hypothetical protein